jgi:hypothetical protein
MFRKVSLLLVLFAAVILCAAPAKAKKATYTPPALSNPASWSMVVVPDVQTYTRFSRNHGILDLMNAWIVDNVDPLKIQQVFYTGDLVYFNGYGIVGKEKNLIGTVQWEGFCK